VIRRALAALAVATLLLAAAPAALAQDCPRTSVGDIENEVMCPVCGTPLGLASEAPQAQREREFIQRLVDDCRSKEEVKAALVAEFGEDVLALPGDGDDDGIEDVLVYAVPALALLAAGAGVAVAVSRWRRSGSRREKSAATDGTAPPGPAPTGAAAARLDRDLDRYDL
jgi:cytochrome c-type biogenesis protein CcmH/NrfF